MAIKDLGTKLSCHNCEAKYYDLNKKVPTCPMCEAEFNPPKVRTRRLVTKSDQPTEEVMATEKLDDGNEVVEENLQDIEVEVESVGDDNEENSTLIEDASDISDDENDIAGVIVNNDESSEVS